ncbi:MAG: DNA translocase FtsK [Bulleidia sp.]
MPRKTKAEIRKEQQMEIAEWIAIPILLGLILLGMLRSGIVGVFLYNLERYLFGSFFYIYFAAVVLLIVVNKIAHRKGNAKKHPLPVVLLIVAGLLISTYIENPTVAEGSIITPYIRNLTSYFAADAYQIPMYGGIIGTLLYMICFTLFGRTGVLIVSAVLIVIACFLLGSLDVYKNAFSTVVDFFTPPVKEVEEEPEPEEEKEPANLWNMIDEHRQKKKQKLGEITADEQPVEEDNTDLLIQETPVEKPVLKQEPYMSKLVNITADDTKEEIPVVRIPGKTISDNKSVFISVDELNDPYETTGEDNASLIDTEPQLDNTEELHFGAEISDAPPQIPTEEVQEQIKPEQPKESLTKMKKLNADYRIPSQRVVHSLLDPLPSGNSNATNVQAAKQRGEQLIAILHNFDISAQLIDTHIGPSVTQFEIRPDATVKVSRILSLTDNIKMALAVRDVRIEAPIPGRNAVGIEVPNEHSTPVKMRELIENTSESDKKAPLLFYVGKNLLGQTVTCRLNKMPHLLIAGATGSGKSVCMNSIITSLLLRTHPDDVKMLLIDPKKVEFTPYHRIPHLIGPVINDPNQANSALKAIVQIMDERYNIFAAAGVRNIEVFNEKVRLQNGRPNPDGSPAPKKMPYIVVIIDELADLMAVAGKDVEQSIQRITQLARAAGIHLIVATQRPSVDVITGIIKANIPSRIAFAVSSGTDSRTILDHVGAERLLGNGDLLYMPIGQSGSERVQGVFVTDEEVQRITQWCSSHGTPEYNDKFVLLEGIENGEFAGGIGITDDPMFEQVKDYVIEAQKASTSLLQRRFGIGYNRAARMIDALEETGVIGPAQGSRPREVYIKPDQNVKRTETGDIME